MATQNVNHLVSFGGASSASPISFTDAYNSANQCTRVNIGGASSASPVSVFDYTYDPLNRVNIGGASSTSLGYWPYTYDTIGQLKTAKGKESGGVTNRLHERLGYAYDAARNLNYRTSNALLQTLNVNSMNELTTVTWSGCGWGRRRTWRTCCIGIGGKENSMILLTDPVLILLTDPVFGTNAVPGVSFPTCSINYFVNSNMLRSDPTTAWWVSGGYPFPRGYVVTLDKGLTFANGQHVVLSESGSFQMYRPDAKIIALTADVGVHSNDLEFGYLNASIPGIGFGRILNIPGGFSGSSFWVQVVSEPTAVLRHNNSTNYVHTQNGPAPYLDDRQGKFPYSTSDVAVDTPGLRGLTTSYVRAEASGSFTMWLAFQPGAYEMWVPLRAVDWYWHGLATNGPSGWVLESNPADHSVDPPDYPTETYPLWRSLGSDWKWVPPLP